MIPETEYIALTDNNYVPLTQAQISNTFQLTKTMDHCMQRYFWSI